MATGNKIAKFFFICVITYMNITEKPQLFCEKYWAKQAERMPKVSSQKITVQEHGKIYTANAFCLINNYPSPSDQKRCWHIIKSVDNDFKQLAKLENDIVLWRGIPRTHAFKNSYADNLYNKTKNLKKGDILVTPAYVYGAVEKRVAESFRYDDDSGGLLLKMNVPKGTQVSLTNFEGIFPRYSKWLCINKEEIHNGFLIELNLILPLKEEIRTNKFLKFLKNILKIKK